MLSCFVCGHVTDNYTVIYLWLLVNQFLGTGLPTSLLRPASSLLRPRGSSVVLLGASLGASSSSAVSSVAEDSWGGSVGASLGSAAAAATGFLRANSGLVRRTCTGALAAVFGRFAAAFTLILGRLRSLFSGFLSAAG